MSDFDGWFSGSESNHHIYEDEKWIAKKSFEAGQQSQQQKIDELQKRIDDAINTLEKSKPNMMCRSDALHALSILKGEPK